uniref:Uncharacterized protein n=2 Tax=Lygus hesperus TaxID=30085 RepID=A0A146L3H8_LYGHE
MEQPQQQDPHAQHMAHFQAYRQNPHYNHSVSTLQVSEKYDEVTPQQTTSASQPNLQTTSVATYNHPSYNYAHPRIQNFNLPPPTTPQPYQPSNNQAPNLNQHTPNSNQPGLYSIPPPNIAWNQHQYPGYACNANYTQNYPTASTPANLGVTLPSTPAEATNVQSQGSSVPGVDYSCNNNYGNSILMPKTTSGMGIHSAELGSSLYATQLTTDHNRIVQTHNPACYPQQNFNSQTNVGQSTNEPLMASANCIPTPPFTPQPPMFHNIPGTSQPGYPQSPFNTQTKVNYFTGAGNVHGMYATEIQNKNDEERRRAVAIYEQEQMKTLYLSQGITKRLVINPNVNIEAQVNQEYFQQCLQGLNPSVKTMENLYAGININSAGQTHSFANFGITNTSTDNIGFPTTGNAHAIQHASYMRPPPPYPVAHVNRLAIDSARNEARNAEAELTASQDRRKQAEDKIIAKEVGKRKVKARSQRMSTNQREAYLRFQYAGRTTRNTQNYTNNSDEGLEEYILQFELAEARNAEQRAAEKVRAAEVKLKAQLEEASRIEAAQTPHPPPAAYNQTFNPVVEPMRQPANKRGRRSHGYQATSQRSNVPGQEYGHSSAMPPPPSYPGPSAAGPQQHQAPYQMPNMRRNPPDYYQAVGPSPSNFRAQHPRRNVTKQNSQYANLYNVATAPQTVKRQVSQEMPHMSAAGSQQYYSGPQGSRYCSSDAPPALRAPSSNQYKAQNRYPVRQTRSTSRLIAETDSLGQANRAPSRATNVIENRPNLGSAESTYFPNYEATTDSNPVFPTSDQTASKPSDGTGPALTDMIGGNSKQVDGTDVDNIENLVPTLPAIPNTIFERCLKEMTPEIPKETERTTTRMEAKIHCHAPFTTPSSIIGTAIPSFVGGRVQPSRILAPAPSTTRPYRRETRSTTRNQNPPSTKSNLEKELEQYFEQHAKNLQANSVDDDFSSAFKEFLEQ